MGIFRVDQWKYFYVYGLFQVLEMCYISFCRCIICMLLHRLYTEKFEFTTLYWKSFAPGHMIASAEKSELSLPRGQHKVAYLQLLKIICLTFMDSQQCFSHYSHFLLYPAFLLGCVCASWKYAIMVYFLGLLNSLRVLIELFLTQWPFLYMSCYPLKNPLLHYSGLWWRGT